MADIDSLLQQVRDERTAQENLIKTHIEEQVKNRRVGFDSLDDNLKSIIMTQTQSSSGGATKAPVPYPSGKNSAVDNGIVVDATFRKVVDDLRAKNNVYLWGKAGTGKTTLAKQVAKELQLGSAEPFYELNCSQWTSPIQISGGWSIDGYKRGQLELAWKHGGILILDELPKLDANTAGLLNSALSDAAEDGALWTSGGGEVIPKHKDFVVIGTGNTDMKSTELMFSGNNRQDYSLVDRFVGSVYKIGYNFELEKSLLYEAVYNIGQGIREWIDQSPNSIEAVTLRSMLNWNRIYELQMLRIINSPLAPPPYKTNGGFDLGKTLKDSIIEGFVDGLGTVRATNLKNDARVYSSASQMPVKLEEAIIEADEDKASFIKKFEMLRGVNPRTGKTV